MGRGEKEFPKDNHKCPVNVNVLMGERVYIFLAPARQPRLDEAPCGPL